LSSYEFSMIYTSSSNYFCTKNPFLIDFPTLWTGRNKTEKDRD
jgi:hypothetical protein